MATETQVYQALMDLVERIAYPNGNSNPVNSIVGVPVEIISGWPNPARLVSPHVVVSVFKVPGLEKKVSSFKSNWVTTSIQVSTLFMTVAGNTVTINGIISLPQTCLISVNNRKYHYKVVEGDTPDTIAAAFAALIPNASANSNVITIENPSQLQAIVGVTGTAVREVLRTEPSFYITIWSPRDSYRQILANAICVEFAAQVRLALPDGRHERLQFHNRRDDDKSQKVNVYRTDLVYSIEYGLTQTATFYTITDLQINTTYVPSL